MGQCYDAYHYTGWEDECDPPEPDKRWLTIRDCCGEEIAVIVQRKRDGIFREDDAIHRVDTAEMIVDALNAHGV